MLESTTMAHTIAVVCRAEKLMKSILDAMPSVEDMGPGGAISMSHDSKSS